MAPVTVVTGANRGISLEVVRQLAQRGHVVYLGSRRLGADADLTIVGDALDTNVLGAWRTTQALLPLLRRSGRPRIVNVSSGAGPITDMGGGTPAYRVSKVALNALTRMWAAELVTARILVHSICPGWVATVHGWRRRTTRRRTRRRHSLGRHPARPRSHRRVLPRPAPHPLVTERPHRVGYEVFDRRGSRTGRPWAGLVEHDPCLAKRERGPRQCHHLGLERDSTTGLLCARTDTGDADRRPGSIDALPAAGAPPKLTRMTHTSGEG